MKKKEVKVKSVTYAAHDVLHIVTEKPGGIDFVPGQATEIFNKTKEDIILHEEFQDMLDHNFINILSDEKAGEHSYGRITEDFIKNNKTAMDAVEKQLGDLKVGKNQIITEEF